MCICTVSKWSFPGVFGLKQSVMGREIFLWRPMNQLRHLKKSEKKFFSRKYVMFQVIVYACWFSKLIYWITLKWAVATWSGIRLWWVTPIARSCWCFIDCRVTNDLRWFSNSRDDLLLSIEICESFTCVESEVISFCSKVLTVTSTIHFVKHLWQEQWPTASSEKWTSNWVLKCVCVMEFLLFSCSYMQFGYDPKKHGLFKVITFSTRRCADFGIGPWMVGGRGEGILLWPQVSRPQNVPF